jgi:hypothetical protein
LINHIGLFIEFFPFFASLFFIAYFVILMPIQMINLSGEFVLTNRRILKKDGLAKIVFNLGDIQNILFVRNQLFLIQKPGRRTKQIRIEFRKQDSAGFLTAYNELKQNNVS